MRSRGFTLIELLVVLVIIGLMAGAVSLVVGGNRERRLLDQEAERLVSVINLARDESIFEGKVFGFAVEDERYLFRMLNDEATQWTEPDLSALRPHSIPEWMSLTLKNDEVAFRLKKEEKQGSETAFEPQVILTPSGEYTPFEAELSLKAEETTRIVIRGDGFNNVERQMDETADAH
ncbi:type II secretion system minor pseudopilin GspH [Hahella sp. SMD15-11]|uniref:Type II secretion system protein H n=1 Tax=Thermohahella caldifontis TaxID=3142973 RepID=A0AB39UYD4_9GAMM